jgi:hypothetical protein
MVRGAVLREMRPPPWVSTRGGTAMPYVVEVEKNCFRCVHLGTSGEQEGRADEQMAGLTGSSVVRGDADFGYICKLGFGRARTIWTGHLALICPHFEERPASMAGEQEEY